MILILALVVAILTCSSAAYAHDDTKQCSSIIDNEARLNCFDEQFGVPSTKVETPEENTGNWEVKLETSPLDDKTNVFLSLNSEAPIRGRFSSSGPMVLHIMCRENVTDFSIFFNGLHMSDHQYGHVTYRIDKRKAQSLKFVESTSHQHLGLWGGRSSIPFIKEFIDANQLLIEATPYGENSVLATFDIGGIGSAISPVREHCHW